MKSMVWRMTQKGILFFMVISLGVLNVPLTSFSATQEKEAINSSGQSAEKAAGKKLETSPKEVAAEDVASKSGIQEPKSTEEENIPEQTEEKATGHKEASTEKNNEPVVQNKKLTDTEAALVSSQTDPRVEVTNSVDGMTMLYAGAALGGVILVAALSSGSSSSSSGDDIEISDTTEETVGPDIAGNDWSGYLRIKDKDHKGYQGINATITHSGNAVKITTTSSLDYGQQLSGTITSSGYLLLYDSKTGEDWTTHEGNATSKKIDLYDYVNSLQDLDRMYLSR